jgi:ribosomal-protein-alanine N-acetyltransferase
MTLPVLKTRRLVLRPFKEGDAEAIANLGGRDFEVARWLTGCTWPYEDGAAEVRRQGSASG